MADDLDRALNLDPITFGSRTIEVAGIPSIVSK
jgi:hypothetical protein